MDAVVARHKAFRAVLGALTMPGRWHAVGAEEPLSLVLDALYADVETALQSGEVVVVDSDLSAQILEGAKRGTDVSPEAGATLFLRIDERTPWTPAQITGPGIRAPLPAEIPLSRPALEARAAACAAFPRGVDIVAIDRDAGVVAYPRTTRIVLR